MIAASVLSVGWLLAVAAPVDSSFEQPAKAIVAVTDRFYSEAWSALVEDAASIATILAICAAGAWAYFQFVSGRVNRPRLELNTSAVVDSNETTMSLLTTTQLKNVGLSKVALNRDGTATRISVSDERVPKEFHAADWRHVATVGAFIDHEWIEPGELIQDQRLFVLPKVAYIGFRVEVRVASRQSEWNAATIVTQGKPHAIAQQLMVDER
jgi:hypothetical protein